jgi:putative transposase
MVGVVRVPDNRSCRAAVTRRMPWRRTNALNERIKFVLEWERRWNKGEGRMNLSELCREFGVSRETAYVWLRRYRAAGHDLGALAERSHRPHHSPHQVPVEVQDLVVALRKQRPTWGPRKLRAYLAERGPNVPVPSVSAFAVILKRNGLTSLRRRRRKRLVVPATRPFAAATEPNAVWCIDFKGWFQTLDGRRCYPLTLIDAYSRYLLRCEAVLDPDTHSVRPILDSAFQEFGLPKAIRSDNGPPFATTGAGGLSALAVWWTKLGIRHDRIMPGKPQQNGRLERFHRTLAELVRAPEADLRVQQRAFDRFRREYNDERPHEALHLKPPLTAYAPSRTRYPRPLQTFADYDAEECLSVDRHGFVRWRRRRVFISTALAHETVNLDRSYDDDRWSVTWGSILLGWLAEGRLDRGLILPTKKRR